MLCIHFDFNNDTICRCNIFLDTICNQKMVMDETFKPIVSPKKVYTKIEFFLMHHCKNNSFLPPLKI